jgi:glycerophosphoryl diester phosphodiesterase
VWPEERPGKTLVIGHRGASALQPENSLDAFTRAARDGADGIELDVLCCATGEVVVFHDDDLTRLGNRPERIADLPLSAVRDVTLTSGARIPTLEEVFASCPAPLLVNVELKTSGYLDRGIGALVDRVAALIERTGNQARVLVSSFHPLAIWAWQRRASHIPAGLLFGAQAALPLRRAWARRWLRPRALHPEASLCTPAQVRRWQGRGHQIQVNVWTVDDAATLRALAAMGVDGIITNDPGRTREILAGRG